MGRWDQREKELDQVLIDAFKLFDSKLTCPLCEFSRKTEKKDGVVTTQFFFLGSYDDRIHDKQSCFVESYLYLMPKKLRITMTFEDARTMAIEQFEAVNDFVKHKEKN